MKARRITARRENEFRMAVNQWIRSGGAFDAVVDFDAATRDPEHPKQFRPGFNNGDHLHPNDAGYQAMADAIDLRVTTPLPLISLRRKPRESSVTC
jgi:lysophospholipase L1-like esterase